jgi:cystathionine gamma-lyase
MAAHDEQSARKPGIDTRAVHAGSPRDDPLGSVAIPIILSAPFDHPELARGGSAPYIYTRYTNPTLEAAEARIAALEETKGARVFSSGMAAISIALRSLLRSGEGLLASRSLYGGTRDLLDKEFVELSIGVRYLDMETLRDPGSIARHTDPKTRLLFLESPTNPMLRVLDVPALVAAAHDCGLRVILDNTFAGPVLARPARWGVDIVCESATKTMSGHSDVIAGAAATDDADLLDRLTFKRKIWGTTLDPAAAYRLARGLATLGVRVRQSGATAARLAEMIATRDWAAATHHPSLGEHPDHDIAKRTLDGPVPLVTFTMKGGEKAAVALRRSLRLIRPAVSLGGVESLLSLPSETSHAQLDDAGRTAVGIPPGTIRLSVGLEDPEDLMADLDQAARRT